LVKYTRFLISPYFDSSLQWNFRVKSRLLTTISLLVCLTWSTGCKPSSTEIAPRRAAALAGETSETTNSDPASQVKGLGKLEETLARRDAANDDWTTEVLNDRAAAKLDAFGDWLSGPDSISAQTIADLLSPTLQFGPLRPRKLTPIYSGRDMQVWRSGGESKSDDLIVDSADQFVASIREFARVFGGDPHVHYKFKIIRVAELGDTVETTAYFQADSRVDTESLQINATWDCAWTKSDAGLRLSRIVVSDYDEVRGTFADGHLFADCTEAVLQGNDSYADQMLKSTNYWRKHLQGSLGVDLFGHQGLAIGDANGDGLDDLYVCQPGGVTNRLYVQQLDGTAVDKSAESGTDYLDRTRAALFLDLDNDADQDLILMVDVDLLFLENDGCGHFHLVSHQFVGTSVSLASADYDQDGDLDIYVCGYSPPRGAEGAPTPYHDANNGYQNHLLRNDISDSNWVFTDVTDQVGLNQNNRRYSFSAAWEDFDNDGDPDLYVANDFGRNNLYRNDDGMFTDIAADAGVEDISAGMSVAWGDYNQDGLFDIYVSNMFSSAGNRVAYQRKFRPTDDDGVRTEFQRHARGNSLFENAGDGTFRDVSELAHVTMGRWAWSSLFCDVNNDTHLDILVTNGFTTNEDTRDL
jgi:hypothetical protein